jgi:hypothetical protein
MRCGTWRYAEVLMVVAGCGWAWTNLDYALGKVMFVAGAGEEL